MGCWIVSGRVRLWKIARRNNWLLDIASRHADARPRLSRGWRLAKLASQPPGHLRRAHRPGLVRGRPLMAWQRRRPIGLYPPGPPRPPPAFRRSVGDWDGAAARSGRGSRRSPSRGRCGSFSATWALERARLAFARIAAFAPLNGLIRRQSTAASAARRRGEREAYGGGAGEPRHGRAS